MAPPPAIHGTRDDPNKQHPVLDIAHWETEFPLGDNRGEGGGVDDPGGVARTEQARRLALSKGDLGPSVPADVFVWSDDVDRRKPWLTRIGGRPWREKGKPWPRDAQGQPLTFLGQICFVDSRDVLPPAPFQLPGDVALIFGTNDNGWVGLVDGAALEWSSLTLKQSDEHGSDAPRHGLLPYEYQGVIHRTVQYTDWRSAEKAFEAAGFKKGGFNVRAIQATSIGAYASLPQGWPFEKPEDGTLVATLSSFYCRGKWPLVDLPHAPISVDGQGRELRFWWHNDSALNFSVGDAGCIWIYRDHRGEFKLDDACA